MFKDALKTCLSDLLDTVKAEFDLERDRLRTANGLAEIYKTALINCDKILRSQQLINDQQRAELTLLRNLKEVGLGIILDEDITETLDLKHLRITH